jgi:glycine/D-amino acid oxidase-like deaminating enzyme
MIQAQANPGSHERILAPSEDAPHGTVSLWMAAQPAPSFETLHEHQSADVCVVGAGIAGLTAAYFLGKGGRLVVVVDAGGGETARTTAHLTCALDDRFTALERLHGQEGARLAARSHALAIDLVERLIRDEGIACEFERVPGYLVAASEHDRDYLRQEREAAARAGLAVSRGTCPGYLGVADEELVLAFPDQAQLHPLRYLSGLAAAIRRQGGRLFSGRVMSLGRKGSNGVRTEDGFRVDAPVVVVATNSPISDRFAMHTKQAAYRTYVIGILVPRGTVPHVLLWDTAQPYHYVRVASAPDPAYEVLLVGGEDHRTGDEDDGAARFARLEAWARTHFHGLGEVRWRWSGQVMEPVDALGFVGRDPESRDDTFIITGDSGNGMTLGTLGGRLVAEQVGGLAAEWGSLYEPRRRTLRAAPRMAREGWHMAARYGALLTPGEVASRREIAPGTGAIVRDGLRKVAVYRDEDGATHECSALCTHLGCVVQWNATERSWDCPCHGSRFGVDGSVLHGPAVTPLGAVGGDIPDMRPVEREALPAVPPQAPSTIPVVGSGPGPGLCPAR